MHPQCHGPESLVRQFADEIPWARKPQEIPREGLGPNAAANLI